MWIAHFHAMTAQEPTAVWIYHNDKSQPSLQGVKQPLKLTEVSELRKVNAIPQNIPYKDNFCDTLEMFNNLYAEKTAFSFRKGKDILKISYSQFYSDVMSFASLFISLHLRDEKIAILGRNSYEWILTYLACVCSGNVIVPINCTLSAEAICNILGETEAKLIFVSDDYSEYIDTIKTTFPKLEIFSLNSDVQKMLSDGEKLEKSFRSSVTVKGDDLAAIIYTSGTTGFSKGVMLTHNNLCSNCAASREHFITFVETDNAKNLLALPMFHAYCFTCSVMLFLSLGTETFISNMKSFRRDLIEQKPDFILIVPVMLEYFHTALWKNAEDNEQTEQLKKRIKLSDFLLKFGIDVRKKLFKNELELFGGNLKSGSCGGAAVNKEVLKEFDSIGINFFAGYGITECSPVAASEIKHNRRAGSVGVPLSGLEIKTDCPDGKGTGEILIKGSSVFKGYYNNPKLTEESFDNDGYFKTGDIGYIDKDGFVYITGRKKNMIVLSNGKNVYPEELEAKLLNNPAIKEILIYKSDNSIAAEIFPDMGFLNENSVSDAEKYFDKIIRDFNSDEPPYRNISRVILRNKEFPKTASTKIKRDKRD